jgi:hypothetical protein
LNVFQVLATRKVKVDWGNAQESFVFRRVSDALEGVHQFRTKTRNFRLRMLVLTGDPLHRLNLLKIMSMIQHESSSGLMYCGAVDILPLDLSSREDSNIKEQLRKLALVHQHRKVRSGNLEMLNFESFLQQVSAKTLRQGTRTLLETSGFEALRANVLVQGFCEKWMDEPYRTEEYVDTLRDAFTMEAGVCIVRGWRTYPSIEQTGGFIDVWWLSDDGGLLILMAHLLHRSPLWKKCKLRVMTISATGKDTGFLFGLLKKLRIEADIIPCDVNVSRGGYLTPLNKDTISNYEAAFGQILASEDSEGKAANWNRKETHHYLHILEQMSQHTTDENRATFM